MLFRSGKATGSLAHDLTQDRDVASKVWHPDRGAALGDVACSFRIAMICSVVRRDFFMGPPVGAKVDLVGPNCLAHVGGNGGGTLTQLDASVGRPRIEGPTPAVAAVVEREARG